jgi:16S rRNA (guanine1207-N2)-methyltransferase
VKGQGHYFDRNPGTDHHYGTAGESWEGVAFLFRTDSGVFSRRRVDPGTWLLVKTVLDQVGEGPLRLLDLGTGAGIAAVVLARLRPAFQVTGVDINRRALALARFNAGEAGVSDRLTLLESDGVPAGQVFDLILTNPPIRAGKATVYRFFREAAASLSPQGHFFLVIRVKQGAASAKAELRKRFERVETLARAKGYHVIKAWHPKKEEVS